MAWFENSFKFKSVGKVTNRFQKYVIIEMPNQNSEFKQKMNSIF